MKKGIFLISIAVALILAALFSVATLAGGKRFDFQIEPGCVVEITPLEYWYQDASGAVVKARGPNTFNLGRASWEDNPPFITLQGEASYDVDLWCPGIATTYQGTIHIHGNACGQQDMWFPLHNAASGVFQGIHVTDGLE